MRKKKYTKTIKISIECPCCEGTGTYEIDVVVDSTTEQMKAMREAGMTLQQIADHFGTVISNVHWHLKKLSDK